MQNYKVTWSVEDQEYVATSSKYKLLSYLDKNPVLALKGLIAIIKTTEDLDFDN